MKIERCIDDIDKNNNKKHLNVLILLIIEKKTCLDINNNNNKERELLGYNYFPIVTHTPKFNEFKENFDNFHK